MLTESDPREHAPERSPAAPQVVQLDDTAIHHPNRPQSGGVMSKSKGGREIRKPKQPKIPKVPQPADSKTPLPTSGRPVKKPV